MKKLSILPFLLISLAFQSCKKEQKSDSDNIETYLQSIGPGKKQFTFQTAQGGTLVGEKGTRLVLNPNTFLFKDDQSQASGAIQVDLIELSDKAEIMMWNKPTRSDNNLLVSGGVAYVYMSQNGREVISTDSRIQFLANDTSVLMQAFGWNDSEKSWYLFNQTPNPPAPPVQTNSDISVYDFPLPSNYNWINCDYFYNGTGNSSVFVEVPGSHEEATPSTSSLVYMAFPTLFSVVRMSPSINKDRFNVTNMPTSLTFRVIAISVKDNKIKAAVSTMYNTTNSAGVIYLEPKSITTQALISLLKSL